MNTTGFKIGILFILFFEVFLGLIPAAFKSTKTKTEGIPWLAFLNSFSAGVFLSIALVHTMPETQEKWLKYSTSIGYENPFPLPFILFLAGYNLVLLFDKVILGFRNTTQTGQLLTKKVGVLPSEIEMKTIDDE